MHTRGIKKLRFIFICRNIVRNFGYQNFPVTCTTLPNAKHIAEVRIISFKLIHQSYICFIGWVGTPGFGIFNLIKICHLRIKPFIGMWKDCVSNTLFLKGIKLLFIGIGINSITFHIIYRNDIG